MLNGVLKKARRVAEKLFPKLRPADTLLAHPLDLVVGILAREDRPAILAPY